MGALLSPTAPLRPSVHEQRRTRRSRLSPPQSRRRVWGRDGVWLVNGTHTTVHLDFTSTPRTSTRQRGLDTRCTSRAPEGPTGTPVPETEEGTLRSLGEVSAAGATGGPPTRAGPPLAAQEQGCP